MTYDVSVTIPPGNLVNISIAISQTSSPARTHFRGFYITQMDNTILWNPTSGVQQTLLYVKILYAVGTGRNWDLTFWLLCRNDTASFVLGPLISDGLSKSKVSGINSVSIKLRTLKTQRSSILKSNQSTFLGRA